MPAPTVTLTPAGAAATHVISSVLRSKDGMVMVYVPAGSFWMGSDEDDSDANDDEKTRHEVYLDAFYIDRYEVTNTQYSQCVEAGACEVPGNCHYGQPTYGDPIKADHPVVCLDWNRAQAYCQWAGARLPTEAEWEKAARGTEGHEYPWGGSKPDCSKAQYDDCDGQTVLVGSKSGGASPYGALDMAGNVWEWVADWYSDDYYANSSASNPQGPATGRHRVLRGGSWLSSWRSVRAASRFWHSPGDSRNPDIGFRCVALP
jgi:formylglycine-generating enzyme required for sulfatase activity